MNRMTIIMIAVVTISPAAVTAGSFSARFNSAAPAGGYGSHLASTGLPEEEPVAVGKYSPAKEAGLSFLLPGLGQYRMGRKKRSYIYFALEGAGWVMFGTSLYREHSKKNAYEEYAVAYAGVNGTGYDKSYYENVGRWASSDGPGGYNEYVKREARDLYYPDKSAMDAYYLENYVSEDMSWRWTSTDAMSNFNDLRGDSEDAGRYALYSVFYLFALRVVSSADAVFVARRENGEIDTSSRVPVRFEAGPRPGGFFFAVNRPF